MREDLEKIKSVHGWKRVEYIWDYYRFRIAAVIITIIILIVAASMLIEGHRHYRLDICVVLNTEDDAQDWFDTFEKDLSGDGSGEPVRVNQDQPFDYSNRYYYVQELEVMTTVSSYRMDAAVCNEDMYSYLLAINALTPLDTVLDDRLFESLTASGRITEAVAGLQVDENGQVNEADGIPGFYAIELTGSAFAEKYNKPEPGEDAQPLYAVIISNTDNMPDCIRLLEALSK